MLWVRVAKHVLWKAEERWKASGESDNKYVLRSMMWADNYRLFCHNREFLHMVNEIIEELMNLDMVPLPESLWWTSSYEEEDKLTLKV